MRLCHWDSGLWLTGMQATKRGDNRKSAASVNPLRYRSYQITKIILHWIGSEPIRSDYLSGLDWNPTSSLPCSESVMFFLETSWSQTVALQQIGAIEILGLEFPFQLMLCRFFQFFLHVFFLPPFELNFTRGYSYWMCYLMTIVQASTSPQKIRWESNSLPCSESTLFFLDPLQHLFILI